MEDRELEEIHIQETIRRNMCRSCHHKDKADPACEHCKFNLLNHFLFDHWIPKGIRGA